LGFLFIILEVLTQVLCDLAMTFSVFRAMGIIDNFNLLGNG